MHNNNHCVIMHYGCFYEGYFMYFIGDVHSQFWLLNRFIMLNEINESIQLGDMGLGFGQSVDYRFTDHKSNHRFIRGNHDNPATCKEMKSYLGNYGYLEDEGIFFVGGAFSIDKQYRTEGADWWPDEELDGTELNEMVALYEKVKPRIVISHDCPADVASTILGYAITPNSTANTFSYMHYIHQPEKWIFAHYHVDNVIHLEGTEFHVIRALDSGSAKPYAPSDFVGWKEIDL